MEPPVDARVRGNANTLYALTALTVGTIANQSSVGELSTRSQWPAHPPTITAETFRQSARQLVTLFRKAMQLVTEDDDS